MAHRTAKDAQHGELRDLKNLSGSELRVYTIRTADITAIGAQSDFRIRSAISLPLLHFVIRHGYERRI